MANFEEAIELVLEMEGKYVNDPSDRGGETKFGISKSAYPEEDIKNLTIERAKSLYKRDYWNVIKGDEILNSQIANSIFDFAVNAGVKSSVKLAQQVCNISDDGIFGPNTLKAINSISAEKFIPLFKIKKIEYYIKICEKYPKNKKFFYGWVRRVML